jgi:hypothetical protein
VPKRYDLAGFLTAHRRQHGTAGEEQAAQVDGHQTVPFFRIDAFDPAAIHRHDGKHRRVVDQHIDAAEALERACRHLLG